MKLALFRKLQRNSKKYKVSPQKKTHNKKKCCRSKALINYTKAKIKNHKKALPSRNKNQQLVLTTESSSARSAHKKIRSREKSHQVQIDSIDRSTSENVKKTGKKKKVKGRR